MARFLVVLDVDSTLIEEEVIELLAEAAGSRDQVAAITSSAMNGEIDFEESLVARVATLAGLPERKIDEIASRIRVTEGARELIAGVQSAGGRVAVVSGGFHQVIDPLAAGLGLDRWRANTLELADGALTGRLTGRIVDGAAKAEALREWAGIYGIPLHHTVAVGDGANDLAMMHITGLAVGFDAKAPVRDKANVIIDVRNLSQVLPLLGLRG
ncbi:MAG TPA: phosphoserine phosphatase SerB [Terrimesophilobacter sp.]|nr:phosphoserine phosphatase SerB [Terrimesophilobacter sp.]